MPDSNESNSLMTRVSVLEEKAAHAESKIASLKAEIETFNTTHSANYTDVKRKIEVLEGMVDELRINTALTKQVISGLEKLSEKLDAVQERQAMHDTDWAKLKGWTGGSVFVAGIFWALFTVFKDYILRFFGF